MQQVPEILDLGVSRELALLIAKKMLRCGIFGLIILLTTACGGPNSQSKQSRMSGLSRPAGSSQSGSSGRSTIRRGLPGEPRTLDPQLADDEYSFQVVRDLFEGLTAEDAQGRIGPGVASSWTINKAGTVYTFKLRPQARWSDGSSVTASEFVEGLRRAVDPRTASGSAELLEVIKGASSIIAGKRGAHDLGVSAVGENILRIELARPAPYILQVLSQPIAAPLRHAMSGIALESKTRNPTVFNGPFVLLKRVYGSYIELARNPFYWDASNVLVDRVRYVISESEATELREYLSGQLDMTYSIPLPDLNRLISQRPSEVQLAPILATFYLAFNLSEPRLGENLDLRRALSMAIDRNLIATKIMLGVSPAYSYVPGGIQEYTPQKYRWAQWTRDRRLEYARTYFLKAGYSRDRPLHLRLYFNSDDTIRRVMIAIAENWKQNLGVDSSLISDEFQVFLAGRKDHSRWDIARYGWNADYGDPASFLEVFARDSPQNDASYSSDKFNYLVGAARTEPDNGTRMHLLENAESVLLSDYALIPVYFYKARHLVKPYIGGAAITPLNHSYSKFLFLKNDR